MKKKLGIWEKFKLHSNESPNFQKKIQPKIHQIFE